MSAYHERSQNQKYYSFSRSELQSIALAKPESSQIKELMPFVNILMGNIWSVEQFLHIPVEYELNGKFDDENLLKQLKKQR
ncbi:hypothetical protein EJ377_01365 [Chryseobacterium arthrosphaerae]|uniref:Uncharacterized protein n=1 Tax=Chryseobacterium arthrosphaerae TaxID=651561 RepID=A0A3S0N4G9_9FLAO|nr:hypothetical protein EJ377_01365 [Chryseobacterium arthrosphaerae]